MKQMPAAFVSAEQNGIAERDRFGMNSSFVPRRIRAQAKKRAGDTP